LAALVEVPITSSLQNVSLVLPGEQAPQQALVAELALQPIGMAIDAAMRPSTGDPGSACPGISSALGAVAD
jgi:hypothetical protein